MIHSSSVRYNILYSIVGYNKVTTRCVDVHANVAAGVGVQIVSVDEDGDVDGNDGMVDVGGAVGLGCLMRSAEGSRREE